MTRSSLPISSSSSSTCSSPSFAHSTSTIWIQSTSSMSSHTHYIIKSGDIATSMTSNGCISGIQRMVQQECIIIMATSKASQTLKIEASENCIGIISTSLTSMTSKIASKKMHLASQGRCITVHQEHRQDASGTNR